MNIHGPSLGIGAGISVISILAAFFIGNEKSGYIKLTGAQPYSVFQSVLDQMLAS